MRNNTKFIQFELWHDCNNRCKFCHSCTLGDIDKIKSIDFISEKLDRKEILDEIGTIGLIGGEIFDDQLDDIQVKEKFYDKLIKRIILLLKENIIQKFYIATSLIFRNKSQLKYFLEYLGSNGILRKCMICTSYDTIGRFNDNNLQLWKSNIQFIKEKYPNLNVHTEMILTGDLIKRILDKSFSLPDFKKQYQTSIDFMSPHIYLYDQNRTITKKEFNDIVGGDFFPKRKLFIDFISKFLLTDESIDLSTFLSNRIRADDYYFILNGQHYLASGRIKSDGMFAGINKKVGIQIIDGYLDSDIRLEDDIDYLLNRIK